MDAAQIVDRFIAAVEAKDVASAVALLHADVSYENMPITPIVGRDAVAAALENFLGPADRVEWVVTRQHAVGNVVVNERIDRFGIGSGWLELPVAGIFEVDDDGLITLWRDYFDLGVYMRQLEELTSAG